MKSNLKTMTLAAVFMALVIILSTVSIPVPGGHLYFNDTVIVLAALLFKPREAFIIGGLGAFLGDYFFYPAPMFVSLVTHGLQAFVIASLSSVGHSRQSKWKVLLCILIGAIIMTTGYTLGRAFVYASPAVAVTKLPFEILQAMIGLVLGYLIYFHTSLKKAFERAIKS